ncbi:hypothetical protein [Bacillus sp. 03113]|uniref:hypothetical protein n=1 Tax=Bacillus sp. 03113 TaxID=2578211 RepID=UPI0015E8D7B0|nr:hypothetical protein [Bacillus sp. 03113]
MPINWFVGKAAYTLFFKESTILVSYSPNHTNKVEIVQKGEALFFGPSSVRVYYGRNSELNEHDDYIIGNDGATLYPENFRVQWEDFDRVAVTLIGEEQRPETVKIDVSK